MRKLVAFGSGLLFAVGLVVGGMTQPKKIVDFLDFFGTWDPSLAFVMGGALLVNAVGYLWTRKRGEPLVARKFYIPQRRDLDWKLIIGAALFGIGWGLGGYCPGPGITAVASASMPALGFVGGLVGGILLYKGFDRFVT
ncbi:MAG: DUF6691 family protein [Bradymonadaceae bacterium]